MSATKHSKTSNNIILFSQKAKSLFLQLKEGSAPVYFKPALVVVALLIAAVILFSVFNPNGGPNYLLYVCNGELYYSDASPVKAEKVTSEQMNFEQSALISDDGKGIFYKDVKGDSLLFRSTTNFKKQPLTLSNEVFEFQINSAGTVATYVKGSNRELYQHNLTSESNVIDNSVVLFYSSDDGNRIIYTKYNEGVPELWFYKTDDKPLLICSGYDSLYNLNKNCNSLLYTKQNAVYKFTEGKKPFVLISNCSDVVAQYDSDELYYCYYETENNRNKASLYYFDGKNSTLITESYVGYLDYADNNPVILHYSTNNKGEKKFYVTVKDKTSELHHNVNMAYFDSSGNKLYFIADVNSDSQMGTLYKAKISGKSLKKAKKVKDEVSQGGFVGDGKFIFFKNLNISERTADLYLNNKKIEESVNISSVIYNHIDKSLIYFKDADGISGKMRLYKGIIRKTIDENVHIGQVFVTEGGDILYLKDFDTNERLGTLFICKNSKGKKVADGVSSIYRYETTMYKYESANSFN